MQIWWTQLYSVWNKCRHPRYKTSALVIHRKAFMEQKVALEG